MPASTPAPDPLVAALDAAVTTERGPQGKVHKLFRNRPEVYDSIKRAYTERGLTCAEIARLLSADGVYVSDKAVGRFLIDEGIK